MRPIDADALLQRWNNLVPRMFRDEDGAIPIDFCAVIHKVRTTPTLTLADLRPKGRWLHRNSGIAYCSECDTEAEEDGTNFCPNCGADMRGDKYELCKNKTCGCC
jgi:hypothetical protein